METQTPMVSDSTVPPADTVGPTARGAADFVWSYIFAYERFALKPLVLLLEAMGGLLNGRALHPLAAEATTIELYDATRLERL